MRNLMLYDNRDIKAYNRTPWLDEAAIAAYIKEDWTRRDMDRSTMPPRDERRAARKRQRAARKRNRN